MTRRTRTSTASACLFLLGAAALAAGCGSSSHGTTAHQTATSAATQPVAAASVPTLSILSPRSGQHTGPTVTVSVRASGVSAPQLVYILDGHTTRHGSTRLSFHALAPGAHRVEVMLADDTSVRAVRVFHVRVPAAAPSSAAAAPAAPSASATSTPASRSSEEAPSRETQKPPEPPPSAKPPSESGGIPQGGGGDGDSDNSGGPSDGDGNL